MKRDRRALRQYTLIACFVFTALFATLLNLNLLILLLSLAVTYLLLCNSLDRKIFNSYATRFLITVLLYVLLLQAVILSSWLIDRNFSLRNTLDVTLIILGLSLAWKWLFDRRLTHTPWQLPKLRPLTFTDSICAVISLGIVGLVLVGPVVKNEKLTGAVALNYINTSLDDSNHLSRINDRIQLDRGVLADTDKVPYVVLVESVSSYPPGWHSANAVIMDALWPNIKVGTQTVIAYVIAKVFWLFVLVYVFSYAVFLLYRRYVATSIDQTLFSGLWLFGAAAFFAYYGLLEQFREGFFSFIPQLTLLLFAGILLIQRGLASKAEQDSTFILLVLTAVGITLSWILALPALFFAVLVAYFSSRNLHHLKTTLVALLKQTLQFLPLVVVSVIAILIQIYLILTTDYRSFSQAINDPGAISLHSSWYYVVLIIGLAFFFYFTKLKSSYLNGVTALLGGLLVFSLFIYLFQIYSIGKVEYYTLKTLNTFVIVSLPIAIVGLFAALSRVTEGFSRIAGLSIVFLALISLPIVIGINPTNTSNLSYIRGNRDLTSAELEYISKSLDTRAATPFASRNQDVIFYTPGSIGHNIVASNILRSIQHIDNCDDKAFTSLLLDSPVLLVESVSQCTIKDRQLTIVTRGSSYETVKNLFNDTSPEKVRVVSIN